MKSSMMTGCFRLAAEIAFFAGMLIPARAATMYLVTDLGPVNAIGINSSGQVLTTGFIFHNGVQTNLPIGLIPRAINDAGVVTGYTGSNNQYQLALYSGGVVSPVNGLTGLDPSVINNAGQIAGVNVFSYNSFLYSAGKLMVVSQTGKSIVVAVGLNASGELIGNSSGSGTPSQAFQYSNGQLTPLSVPGAFSQVGGINDAGTIVGSYGSSPNSLLTTGVFSYDSSGFHSLGPAFAFGSGEEDYARAVNNAGTIVGTTQGGPSPGFTAWAWFPDSGFANLNSLVPTGSGWQLFTATGINSGGQIIGSGFINGRQDAFLLTPVNTPEPGTLGIVVVSIGLGISIRALKGRAY